MSPRPMNADPALARRVVARELALWQAYWDPTFPNQDHQLYVPGVISELSVTLRAIDEGIDYGQPDDHVHIKVCRYFTRSSCPRGVHATTLHAAQWRRDYAGLTQDDWDRDELHLLLWHPINPENVRHYDVAPLGRLDRVASGSYRQLLSMPWLPHDVVAPDDHLVQHDRQSGTS